MSTATLGLDVQPDRLSVILAPDRVVGPDVQMRSSFMAHLLHWSRHAAFAALLASSCLAAGIEPAERYRTVRPSADGIGKVYMGREIAEVMGWQAAPWLERDEREQEERSDVLIRLLDLKPGNVVADVGAGSGYYTRRIANRVGPSGRVFAVDVQPEMIRMLGAIAKRPEYAHVVPVLGSTSDVKLPTASVDLAIMVDVYHELEFPFEVLASLVRAVKPGGRIVLVEYRAEDAKVPIKPMHKMSEAQVRREVQQHDVAWERTENALPWQHVVVFRRK